jgi:hypothetical protein
MSFHSCWDLKAASAKSELLASKLLVRLAAAFPVREFDSEGAQSDAAKRLAALTALGASEAILAGYRDARPVRVRLANDPATQNVLDFTIWPGPDGMVAGTMVSFATADHEKACFPLLERVAEVLGWENEKNEDAS